MVKNHKLAKSISDASWYQFTQWVDYFASLHKIVCVSVAPNFTTQDCSVCQTRVKKSLSTRTHQCPKCKVVLDRDHNAGINILKKGLELLGEIVNGTVGHTGTEVKSLKVCGQSDLWSFIRENEISSRLETPDNGKDAENSNGDGE